MAVRKIEEGEETRWDYRTLVTVFKALSDETRQKVLVALSQSGEMKVNDLVRMFGVAQPTMSHHLGVLKNAGLVNDRREGQFIFYSVNRGWLVGCCGGFLAQFETG